MKEMEASNNDEGMIKTKSKRKNGIVTVAGQSVRLTVP